MPSPIMNITMAPSDAIFAELESFLAEFGDFSFEFRKALVDRIQAFSEAEIFELNQFSTVSTLDITLELKLTQGFRDFMSAARAGDFYAV